MFLIIYGYRPTFDTTQSQQMDSFVCQHPGSDSDLSFGLLWMVGLRNPLSIGALLFGGGKQSFPKGWWPCETLLISFLFLRKNLIKKSFFLFLFPKLPIAKQTQNTSYYDIQKGSVSYPLSYRSSGFGLKKQDIRLGQEKIACQGNTSYKQEHSTNEPQSFSSL